MSDKYCFLSSLSSASQLQVDPHVSFALFSMLFSAVKVYVESIVVAMIVAVATDLVVEVFELQLPELKFTSAFSKVSN
jgi:hypothetical protein